MIESINSSTPMKKILKETPKKSKVDVKVKLN